MNIFARVKEIGLRQNTHMVNAHSCLFTTNSLAAGSLFLSSKPTPSFPNLSPQSRTSLIHNIIWYRAPIFTFLTFIIVKGKRKQQQQKNPTNKQKINQKTKNFRLTPKQTAIFFSLFFPSNILGF